MKKFLIKIGVVLLAVVGIFTLSSQPKESTTPLQGAGQKLEESGTDDKQGTGKAPWRNMTLNGKLVTNTANYQIERNKVFTEIKKFVAGQTVDYHAIEDWNNIIAYELCLTSSSSIRTLDLKKMILIASDAMERGVCITQ